MARFADIEARCSRFDIDSELAHLSRTVATPVRVSAPLFEVMSAAVTLADASSGAFDPTVGARMEAAGFNRNYRTGETIDTPSTAAASWRYILIDAGLHTVTLRRPLALDLGAIAKGYAVDLAMRELRTYRDVLVDAGGDIAARGLGPSGLGWPVAVQHPRDPTAVIDRLFIANAAVCTSGDYERRSQGLPYILTDGSRGHADDLCSVTVVADDARTADALATAAFALGARDGLRLIHASAAQALLYTVDMEPLETPGMARYRRPQH